MARHHMTADGEVPFTAEEEAEWDRQEAEATAAALPKTIAAAISRIDADVDAIYAAVVGNRLAEYNLAEEEALAFKASGYAGTAPASVQAWADAKQQTAQWAADDIIATAVAWRTAQATIRAHRLARKEACRAAADQAGVAAALLPWAAFVAAIRAQLGLPGIG